MVGLGGLEPPTSPYQGLLWCYMHSSVAMIMLLTTSLMVTSWHDCWFQVARSAQSGDHFLQADLSGIICLPTRFLRSEESNSSRSRSASATIRSNSRCFLMLR